MFSTLTCSTRTVCATPQVLFKEEEEHINKALSRSSYQTFDLERLRDRHNLKQSGTWSKPKARGNNNNCTNNANNNHNICILVPYTKGLSKSVKDISDKLVIHDHFRSCNAIKALLKPTIGQGQHHSERWNNILYKCCRLKCDEEYIEESARTSGKKVKEHLRAPSPSDHANALGHHTKLGQFLYSG